MKDCQKEKGDTLTFEDIVKYKDLDILFCLFGLSQTSSVSTGGTGVYITDILSLKWGDAWISVGQVIRHPRTSDREERPPSLTYRY